MTQPKQTDKVLNAKGKVVKGGNVYDLLKKRGYKVERPK